MALIDVIYSPAYFGRTSFPLKHNKEPIFYKKFNAQDNLVVDLDKDTIFIKDHFFKTGESLLYNPLFGGIRLGISSSSPGANGILTELPEQIFPIVVDKDRIKISLSEQLALSNSYVNINSLGIGTIHSIQAVKQNTKCLITIDNVIQSPVSEYSRVNILRYDENDPTRITIDSIEDVKLKTILKIGDELCRVKSIDYDLNQYNGYYIGLDRSKNVLGTDPIDFTGITTAIVISGNYNIVKDIIYFSESPLEGISYDVNIPVSSLNFTDFSFNLFTDKFQTGDQVFLYSLNPPTGLENESVYYIIKNFENNFSFAKSYLDATSDVPIKIEFTNPLDQENPITSLNLSLFINQDNSSFTGRVFLRSNYSGNLVFDDISREFDGITTSFELKSSGISTVGIKSDNGIVLINNVFQYPEFEESFIFNEDNYQTNIVWNGSIFPLPQTGIGSTASKDYDVNVRGLPRGGIIVSYATSSGSNYQPLIGAEAYVYRVLPENIVTPENIEISVSGSGYRSGVSSVTFETTSGIQTSGSAQLIISNGSVQGLNVTNPPIYTADMDPPTIRIDPPTPYENIALTGSQNGVGARVSFDITKDGTVSNFRLVNPGYGYTAGEILTPVGIVGFTTQTENEKLKVIITQTAKDDFSAWNIGSLRKLDDLSPYVNGSRKIFELRETINGKSSLISLESISGSEIDLAYNLLVFLNDVLQIPNDSYTFSGGSQIQFSEAIPKGSSLKIYFYKGFEGDTQLVDLESNIKVGDTLQIKKDLITPIPKQQYSRTIKKILSSSQLLTELYGRQGLSIESNQKRSISLTPQKKDIIISGEYISKSREINESKVDRYSQIVSYNGTFASDFTNVVGITTTNITIGDYAESNLIGVGVSVISIGENTIELSDSSLAPAGASSLVTIYRKL